MSDSTDQQSKTCPVCDEKFPPETEICPAHGAKLVIPSPDPLIGTTLAERYEVLAELGRGGTSIVYRGRHRMMNKPIAIKMLRSILLDDSVSIRRFQQEAQVVSKLSHTHIVAAHDFGLTSDQRPYLVMDLVEGVTLAKLIEKDGFVPPPAAVDIFLQVCEGLQHAHEVGLVHRDLKPDNIILLKSAPNSSQHDLVKILDFGIAKFLPQAGVAEQRLTETGCVFGTSLYMSPEHCMGKNLDARSDIYSLGCVMFETLTGKPPFVGDNVLDTMQKQISDKPETLQKLRADIPDQLASIVLKAMAKEPAARYQNVSDLTEELRSLGLASGASARTGSYRAGSDKYSRVRKWLPIAALCALVIAGTSYLFPRDQPVPAKNNDTTIPSNDQSDDSAGKENVTIKPAAASVSVGAASDAEIAPITDDPEIQSKLTSAENRTAERLASLALTCHKNGKCDIAERLFQEAIVVSQRVYGPNSPQTADRINDLATFYLGIGMTDRAEPLLKQLMEMKQPGKGTAKGKRGA